MDGASLEVGFRRLLSIACGITALVAGAASHPQAEPQAASAATGAQSIPVRVEDHRFFATLTTARGEPMTLLLDTADSSRVWDTSAARLGLPVQATSAAAPTTRAALPAFRPMRGLPSPSSGGGLVLVVPPQDQFDTLMARVTDGQLGWDWFADRIWTLDYPGQKLWLQSQGLPPSPAEAHDVQLGFAVDAAGRRIRQVPRIGVEIDGESWNMLFDTGATAW